MTDHEQSLEIAIQIALAQRNEQADRALSYATELETAKRKIATLEAKIKELCPTDTGNPPNGSVNAE
jgi:phage anti-repressor protein